MYRKGTYLAYNNNVKQDGPCKKILCLYTDKRYDYIVRLSSAYLCDQNNVISLQRELLSVLWYRTIRLLKSAEMCSRYVKEVGIDSVLALEDVAAHFNFACGKIWLVRFPRTPLVDYQQVLHPKASGFQPCALLPYRFEQSSRKCHLRKHAKRGGCSCDSKAGLWNWVSINTEN